MQCCKTKNELLSINICIVDNTKIDYSFSRTPTQDLSRRAFPQTKPPALHAILAAASAALAEASWAQTDPTSRCALVTAGPPPSAA